MDKAIAAILAIVAILAVAYMAGAHSVRVEWDKEKAVRQAQLEAQQKLNEDTNAIVQAQHEKDLSAAKSKAGRDAVADYLRSHGMLPASSAVQCAGQLQAEDSVKSDGTAEERGASSKIESFATNCALDALQVMRWQEWASREGLANGQ